MDQKSKKEFSLEDYIILVPFSISVLLTLAAFVMKLVGSASAGVATVLSYYAYAWVCCICVSQCVYNRKHLQISLFDKTFPEAVIKALKVITEVIIFVVIACVFAGSFMLLKDALATGAMDAKTPQIPLALGYCAPIVGYGMALVRYILRMVKGGAEK